MRKPLWIRCCVAVAWVWFVGLETRAALSVTSLHSAFTESFDTLANSGTSTLVPNGWAFAESGVNANTSYTAGSGVGNAGDTYSFGQTASTERAFGCLQSGSLIPTLGLEMRNDTGSVISSFAISYAGEQWRLGATARPDRLDFQYSLNAGSLTTGTWTDFDTLDFVAPVTSGVVGALDGNSSANRLSLSGTVGGLSIPSGDAVWIRWTDFNATGADDGLAIDDFSVTAIPEPAAVGIVSAVCLLSVVMFRLGRRGWGSSRGWL